MDKKELECLEIVPKAVNNIFILLHGYGSNNDDILSAGLAFKEILPNTAFISVRAPDACELGCGFQWFSLKTMNLFKILKEIKLAHSKLNSFIDTQLARFSLRDQDLLMGGFSQGAIMSLYTGIRRLESPLCLMSFSGMMAETVDTLRREMRCKPECFLSHGTSDFVVPYASLERTEFLLREFDIPYSAHSMQGMGHEINGEVIQLAKDFIMNICNKY